MYLAYVICRIKVKPTFSKYCFNALKADSESFYACILSFKVFNSTYPCDSGDQMIDMLAYKESIIESAGRMKTREYAIIESF